MAAQIKIYEKIKVLALALLLIAALMLASFFAGWKVRGERIRQAVPVADTTWFTVTEQITVPSPPDTIVKTFTKVVRVPLYEQVHDTVVDSVWVSLPYERHFARLDSVADVWYSGYDAKIDSAVVYKYKTTQIIKQPYEVAKMPKLTAGMGVGAIFHESRVKPYLVGEMRYNRQKTTFSAFGAVDPQGNWAAGVGVTYRLNLIK